METTSFSIFYILIPLLVILFAFGIVAFLIFSAQSFDDKERKLIPLHSEKCAVWIGAMNYKYPLARITIYDEFVVISYIKKIFLKYDEIQDITIEQYFRVIKKGVTIKHNRSDLPKRIVVFSFNNNEKIMEIIKGKIIR